MAERNKVLISLLSIFLFVGVKQSTAQEQKIMSSYNRPTVAHIILQFDDQSDYEENVIAAFGNLPLNPKYNQAGIGFTGLTTKQTREEIYNNSTIEASKKLTDRLRRFVSDNAEFFQPIDTFGLALAEVLSEKFNVGGLMLKEWATKDSGNGNYSVIEERSQYNLNAIDIQAKKDYSKLDVFKGLLLNNYIIVYDVQDQQASGKLAETAGGRVGMKFGGTGEDIVRTVIHAYIYKVEISEELFNSFVAPYFGDASKIGGHKYPVKYVGHAAIKQDFSPKSQYDLMRTAGNVKKKGIIGTVMGEGERDASGVMKPEYMNASEPGHQNNVLWENLSPEERDIFTYSYIAETCFEDVLSVAEMFLDDFKIKAVITNANPVSAAIGLREGISADQRFRVYENVYKDGDVITQSVGIVRSTNKIADNIETLIDPDSGEFMQTTFKQVYGNSIREDMLLIQENDFGVSFSLGTTFGYFKFEELPSTIFHFRGSYNISRNINKILGKNSLYGFHAYFGLGLGSKKWEAVNGRINTFAIDLGLEKHLYLSPRFDIIPETGLTINTFGVSTSESIDFSDEGYLFWNIGVRFPIMVKENIAIEPAFHIPIHLSSNAANPASILHFSLRGRINF